MDEPTPPTISRAKATLVRTLMATIMLLTGSYVGVDWCEFYYHFTSSYPAGAGYARTVLCFMLVLLIGPTDVSRLDRTLLGVAFLITLVADYFLILTDHMTIGTVIFLAVHATYVVRHAQGFRESLAPDRRARTIKLLAVTALVAYGGTVALIVAVAPILKRTGMFALDCVYLVFLATSLWMAWGAVVRSYYQGFNAWMIAIGMTFFYLCDVSVGLAAALAGQPSGWVLNNMVGLFYTPALVLLAFSGFRWFRRAEPRLAMSGDLTGLTPG